MESNVSMMEGTEWGSSFHGVVSFNEEADFMAQWFPNCALDNNNNHLESLSSSCYSGLTIGGECGSFFSNNHEDDDDDYKNNNNNSNMCSLAQEMISNTSYSDNCNNNNNTTKSPVKLSDCLSVAYPFYYENGFLGATDDNNNDCSFPVELCPSVAKNFIQLFPGNPMERNDSLSGLDQHSDEQLYSNNKKHQENEMSVSLKKDKSTENLGCGRKRSRISENNKGKKNTRTKNNKNNERNNNDNNNGCDNNEENNSSSSEEESHEMSGGVASSSLSSKGTTIVNTNGKTRASRGAATDPQSLYARKRRERINERLRILQNLVPNGTKVDISTMLEEAVHYVKFLQQQIKLLSSDDLWMYAPLAYNGMEIGLDSKLTALL